MQLAGRVWRISNRFPNPCSESALGKNSQTSLDFVIVPEAQNSESQEVKEKSDSISCWETVFRAEYFVSIVFITQMNPTAFAGHTLTVCSVLCSV